MNTEVRVGSYLAVIRCAEANDIQEIVTKITADSNKQGKELSQLHDYLKYNNRDF